jgi:hypothetical protein
MNYFLAVIDYSADFRKRRVHLQGVEIQNESGQKFIKDVFYLRLKLQKQKALFVHFYTNGFVKRGTWG